MDYLKKAIWGPDPKEQKTETFIKQSAKKNDVKSVKTYAREMYMIKKMQTRLYKSKAQLDSVGMQIDESFAMANLQKNMKMSTGIMQDVNSLVKLPALTHTMRELEQELMKSGIINDMVGDTIDTMDEMEAEDDEEVEEEVNKIVSEFTTEKLGKVGALPHTKLEASPEPEPVVEDDEHVLNEMRERLKALQS
ncbi:Vacuolar protein-sorting-associated protein 24 [Cyberlindnera fabianii]|uniref:Vacuolar protein-sorting-associated protein 24 n=1 Tax=Cyberlindnera fabianii TaxID=36022 RepID=A0A1V2LDQ0_CYBFA|nr:Vacuolar protein-sorting-associated protein 24 [Cyberlindnera fabianii]